MNGIDVDFVWPAGTSIFTVPANEKSHGPVAAYFSNMSSSALEQFLIEPVAVAADPGGTAPGSTFIDIVAQGFAENAGATATENTVKQRIRTSRINRERIHILQKTVSPHSMTDLEGRTLPRELNAEHCAHLARCERPAMWDLFLKAPTPGPGAAPGLRPRVAQPRPLIPPISQSLSRAR